MAAIELEWSGGRRELTSCDALRDLLRELDRQLVVRPELVDIVGPSGAILTVGLGAEASVLSFAERPERPPYYGSQGDGQAIGSIWFDYGGSPSEFPMESAVSILDALAAAEEFCRTDLMPTAVRWEAV